MAIMRFSAIGRISRIAMALLCVIVVPGARARSSDGNLPLGLPRWTSMMPRKENIDLGDYLFRDPVLSSDGRVACISCHSPALGFTDNRRFSLGADGTVTTRRALPLVNLFIFSSFMADGRAMSLHEQHVIPLESHEMGVNWQRAFAQLTADGHAIKKAEAAGALPFTKASIIEALAAYVGTLISGGSRFDQYYYGRSHDALTPSEQRGFRIFVHKAHCSSCHLLDGFAAPMTDASFHSVGVGFIGGRYLDLGRYAITHDPNDDGSFKTPSLRNVALRTFFMHDGSISSLIDVVRYYNKGGTPRASNQDPRIKPLFLNDAEMEDLVSFLGSLTAPISNYLPSR